MSEDRIRLLLSKYIHRQCNPQEEAELFSFLRELSDEQKDDLLANIWNDFESKQELPEEEAEQILDAILTRRRRFPLKYISIAASVLIVLSTGAYFLLHSNRQLSADHNKIALTDIRPGENKAELSMGNGKRILLGTGLQKITVPNTDLVIQENANGSLTYNKSTITDTEPITYDTLRTPRGGVYQLNLGDGTKIWLNTASAIRFPEKFGHRNRDVELLYGEAYFEVQHRTDAPFTVKTTAGVIRDLGTHFNVNTGTGDGQVAATLLEGAIQIETNKNIKRIKPGQQALFNGGKLSVHEVDAEEMIAWKDGYFMFDETMESAMQKISLWYDVKVEYQDAGIKGIPVLATITRSSNISNVLSILEMTKKVRFNIDGRTVKVFYFNQNTAK
ncbi:FecR family protein [Chitinophaga filiformis]|uniref:FecR family protein n=1 Tax=Chitinophaga filiformis TaxID=104663 RepID=A0ABY4HV85_CHIFI|nr:FecR domain-containing protein [Chitinophaga filiformis]UPK67305.1 FecR family protein [Chitinophaga filiformis]